MSADRSFIAVCYVVGVALTYLSAYVLGATTLTLLPAVVLLSYVAARFTWRKDWPRYVGWVRPCGWIVPAVLLGVLGAYGYLLIGWPDLRQLASAEVVDAVSAAVAEEIIFRGVLLGFLLAAMPRPVAVVAASAAFGAMHFVRVTQGEYFSDVTFVALSAFALGSAFCVFRLWMGLGASIVVHAAWNAWALCGDEVAVARSAGGLPMGIAAVVLASYTSLLERRKSILVGGSVLGIVAGVLAWGPLKENRDRRDALRMCTDWGVNDLQDYARLHRPGQWVWSGSLGREQREDDAPHKAIDLLLDRSAIGFLRHTAAQDPDGRMRVAASGLLRRMVDERVAGWIAEGDTQSCWWLLMALRAPRSGGAVSGPDEYALMELLRLVGKGAPDYQEQMIADLLRRLPTSDDATAWAYANALRHSGADLSKFGRELVDCLSSSSSGASAACAYLLAYVGPITQRENIEHVLAGWLKENPDDLRAKDALAHLAQRSH